MEAITTAMEAAFTTIQGDVMSMIAVALPFALTIVGAGLAVTIGIKFFKKVAGK